MEDPPTPTPAIYDYTTTITDPVNSTTSVEVRSTDEEPVTNHRIVRIESVQNGEGETTDFEYDNRYRLSGIVQPEGNATRYGYTDRGEINLVVREAKAGSPLADTTVSATYTAGCPANPSLCNRPTATVDARGAVTDYVYDAAGNLLTETQPTPTLGAVRPQTRYTYQSLYAWYRQNGSSTLSQAPSPVSLRTQTSSCSSGIAPACVGTANEVRTTTTYQAGGSGVGSNVLPVTVTSGSGNGALTATTRITYDANSDLSVVTGPLGGQDYTRHYHDAMRQRIGVATGSPDNFGPRNFPAVRTTYNADGQVVLVERGTNTIQGATAFLTFAPLESISHAYDTQGRKVRETRLGGATAYGVTQYAYDNAGRLTCTAVRMNPSTWSSLPTSACTLATAGSYGPDRVTSNTYDLADRLLTTQTGYGTPDVRALLTQTWTPNGEIDWIQDAQSNRSDYVYDGFDRVAQLSFPLPTTGSQAANPSDYEAYGYDANDNPTSKRTRAGDVFTTTFDALNRVTFIDAPSGSNDVGYTYDLLNRQLSATHPGGQSVTMTWDALGRQTTETGRLGTTNMAYDLKGRLIQQTLPGAAFSVTYGWFMDNGMASATVNGSQSVATFLYDRLGRRTQLSRGNGTTTTYAYDGGSRLTTLTHDLAGTASDQTYTFAYSPADQMVTRDTTNSAYSFAPAANANTYVNNGLNQPTTAGALALTWDARGNLTQIGTVTQTYDSANRLITNGGGTLSYDPLDRLSQLVGTQGAVYGYSGSDEISYLANDGVTVNNRFVRGPWADEILASWSGTTSLGPVWWIQDHQASTIAIVDTAGNPAGLNRYDEYGRPASGNTARFQFTGQLWLGDFGVYHYKARAYHPGLGRFMQTDPVGYEQGLNLYAYVANDPVNNTDPTGMQAQDQYVVVPWWYPPVFVPGTQENNDAAGALNDGLVGLGNLLLEDRMVRQAADGIIGIFENRSREPDPLPEAEGRPHSTTGDYGGRGYTEYGPNDPVTGRPTGSRQYRPPGSGTDHNGVDRPNVKERPPGRPGPDGAVRPGRPVVRPPREDEHRPQRPRETQ